MTSTHVLKTAALYFDAVESGAKTFEVRRNDRAFQTGDILELVRVRGEAQVADREFAPIGAKRIRKRIGYLLQGGQFGIEPGYCVLGLAEDADQSQLPQVAS